MTEASVIHFYDFDFVYNAYFDNFIERLLINLYIFYVFFLFKMNTGYILSSDFEIITILFNSPQFMQIYSN